MGPTSLRATREQLYSAVSEARVEIVVATYELRHEFGRHVYKAPTVLLTQNDIADPVNVFLDKGIAPSESDAEHWRKDVELRPTVSVFRGIRIENDSWHSSVRARRAHDQHDFLSKLGLVNKSVKSGEGSGFDPNDEVPLAFELWARLRWRFFSRPITNAAFADAAEWGLVDTTCAFHVAEGCSQALVNAVWARFAATYPGCIH